MDNFCKTNKLSRRVMYNALFHNSAVISRGLSPIKPRFFFLVWFLIKLIFPKSIFALCGILTSAYTLFLYNLYLISSLTPSPPCNLNIRFILNLPRKAFFAMGFPAWKGMLLCYYLSYFKAPFLISLIKSW